MAQERYRHTRYSSEWDFGFSTLHAVLDPGEVDLAPLSSTLRGLLMRILLASSSPRRRELLSTLVPEFETVSPEIDETPCQGEKPRAYVARLAASKAGHCAASGALSLGADTTVCVGRRILGKPSDADDARRMLSLLSGTTHEVHTAVALASVESAQIAVVSTAVTFTQLSDEAIERFLMTDEPWDKAGGYGIQGYAGSFVARIEGSYSAVVGLPLCETRALLVAAGVTPRHG